MYVCMMYVCVYFLLNLQLSNGKRNIRICCDVEMKSLTLHSAAHTEPGGVFCYVFFWVLYYIFSQHLACESPAVDTERA